jgi:hypothetical protein
MNTSRKRQNPTVIRPYLTHLITVLGFNSENLDRLTRGLHYAMWMQDKMLQVICGFWKLVSIFV